MKNTVLQRAGEQWSSAYPEVTVLLDKLVCRGVGVAVSFSSYSAAVASAQGMKFRESDDIDLLVLDRDIHIVRQCLGDVRVEARKHMTMRSADSRYITFVADEFKGYIGGKCIQFMGRKSLIRVSGERQLRDFTITNHMMRMRSLIETSEGVVPFVHPADAILPWSIFQRGGAKDDRNSVALLRSLYDLEGDRYSQMRIRQMGLQEREMTFLDYGYAFV